MHRRRRIDPRVIGSFVVGAIILSVAGLVFFGPGGFFSETRTYVVHFEGSVKGLNVGSPVRFRGVKIGQVKEINVRVRPKDFEFHIPVVIEIEPSRIKAEGSSQGLLDALKTSVQGDDPILSLVDKGLRAQLQLDSLVTGQLYVNLDMLPDTPVVMTGYRSEYPELPTTTSSLEELTKTFEDLPLKELADTLIRSAEGIEKIINSPNLHNAMETFDATAVQMEKLLTSLNTQLPQVMSRLDQTLQRSETAISKLDATIEPLAESFTGAMTETRVLLNRVDGKIAPLSDQLLKSLQAFDLASTATADAMQQLQGLSQGDSNVVSQLTLTLREVNRAARTVRYLAEELERDPQMLLRGKPQGDSP